MSKLCWWKTLILSVKLRQLCHFWISPQVTPELSSNTHVCWTWSLSWRGRWSCGLNTDFRPHCRHQSDFDPCLRTRSLRKRSHSPIRTRCQRRSGQANHWKKRVNTIESLMRPSALCQGLHCLSWFIPAPNKLTGTKWSIAINKLSSDNA